MQCEGIGIDWVARLQAWCADKVSDEAFAEAQRRFTINPPQSKDECYYRLIFDKHFPGFDKCVRVWDGGCRAAGCAFESKAYTRHGLADTNTLKRGCKVLIDEHGSRTNQ